MGIGQELKKEFENFSEFLANNPEVADLTEALISMIPICGKLLAKLFKKSVDTMPKKIQLLTDSINNLKNLDEVMLEQFARQLDKINSLEKDTNGLLKFSEISKEMFNAQNIKLAEIIKGEIQIEIDLTKLHVNLISIGAQLGKKIDRSTKEIKEHITHEIAKKVQTDKLTKSLLLLSNDYLEADFDTQVKLFKKKVCEDYENPPEKPDRPIIANFRKLHGFRLFVSQRYKLIKKNEVEPDIYDFVTKIIKRHLSSINQVKNFENALKQAKINIENTTLPKAVVTKLEESVNESDHDKDKSIEDARTLALTQVEFGQESYRVFKRIETLKTRIDRENAVRERLNFIEKELSKIESEIIKTDSLAAEIKKLEEGSLIGSTEEELTSKIQELQIKYNKYKKNYTNNLQRQKTFSRDKEDTLKIVKDVNEAKEELVEVKKLATELGRIEEEKISKAMAILDQIQSLKDSITFVTNAKDTIAKLRTEKLIPIVGDYGSGKSALSHHILFEFSRRNDAIPIFIPLGQLTKHDDQENHLLEDIYEYVTNKEYHFNIEKDDFEKKMRDGRFLFILDALDEMSNRLDSEIAQKHLSWIIELSHYCVTLLTSRETYLSEGQKKDLIHYHGLIKILDFELPEIKRFLELRLGIDNPKVSELMQVISDERFSDFAKKPLFLEVIQRNYDNELKNYLVINESVILEVLTNEWIIHDTKVEEANEINRKQIIVVRKKISEILAFAEYRKEEPIGMNDILSEVKSELIAINANAERELPEYYKDAISSTFLINEEGEAFRFILRPIMEYFIANRIVSEMNELNSEKLITHINLVRHVEIFDFIRGRIAIEWGIKPEVQKKVELLFAETIERFGENAELSKNRTEFVKYLHEKRDRSSELFNIIRSLGPPPKNKKVGNLVRVLHITGNLPPRPNLSNIDLTGIDLSGADLSDADLRGAKLDNTNLSGANLSGAKLQNLRLEGTSLAKSILRKSNFSGAKCKNVIFSYADLNLIEFNSNTKFLSCDFTGINLKGEDLRELEFTGSKFINVDFEECHLDESNFTTTDFRSAKLHKAYLNNAIFHGADLRDANLINARLFGTKFNRAKLDYANFTNALTDNKTDFSSVKKCTEAIFKGVDLNIVIRFNSDFTSAIRE